MEREINIENEFIENKLQFFTNISHEFKTPLILIVKPLQNILSIYQKDKDLSESIKVIRNNTNRLMRLINQLMEFRKTEAGYLEFKPEKGDIVHFLEELSFSFMELAKEKGITFNFKSQVDKLTLSFDKDKVEKIFYNLILNAFNHIDNNANKISVEFSTHTDNNSPTLKDKGYIVVNNQLQYYFQIVIKNNGCEMSEEKLQLIFEHFYEEKPVGLSNYIGSGIGLYLSRKLVRAYGGYMSVYSKKDKGNVFTVRLPLFQEDISVKNSKNKSLSQCDRRFLKKIQNIVEENVSNSSFTVKDLEKKLAYSRMQLYRSLKSTINMSANEFIRNYRLYKAKELLRKGEYNVTEVLYKVGITNHSYFTKCFKNKYGIAPKKYVKKQYMI